MTDQGGQAEINSEDFPLMKFRWSLFEVYKGLYNTPGFCDVCNQHRDTQEKTTHICGECLCRGSQAEAKPESE